MTTQKRRSIGAGERRCGRRAGFRQHDGRTIGCFGHRLRQAVQVRTLLSTPECRPPWVAGKSDTRDALELCEGLRRGFYRSLVHVPSPAISDMRTTFSRRRHFIRIQTAEVNAVKRLLRGVGRNSGGAWQLTHRRALAELAHWRSRRRTTPGPCAPSLCRMAPSRRAGPRARPQSRQRTRAARCGETIRNGSKCWSDRCPQCD